MEGFSSQFYKGKMIVNIDYSRFGTDKEKIVTLVRGAVKELSKEPPKSVLSLVNVTNMHFDKDITNAFRESRGNTPYEKKTAVVGLNGLQRIAYNYMINLSQREVVRAFDSEQDAKEWLVS